MSFEEKMRRDLYRILFLRSHMYQRGLRVPRLAISFHSFQIVHDSDDSRFICLRELTDVALVAEFGQNNVTEIAENVDFAVHIHFTEKLQVE